MSGSRLRIDIAVTLLPEPDSPTSATVVFSGTSKLHAARPPRRAGPAVFLAQAEGDAQVVDRQQHSAVRGVTSPRSFGSSASRSASVSSENAVTKTAMKAVAATSCHQWPRISSLCASASIVPHDTSSTPTPRPRYDRITSALMKPTTSSDSCTRTTWLTFGRMWRNMRAAGTAPIASAART